MPSTTFRSLYSIFYDPVFLSTLMSWLTAQVIKTLIEIFRLRLRSSKAMLTHMLWRTGGMPSSHSAVVASLATAVGFTQGVESPLFVSLLFYGLLVIRDALGVRRSAGLQARLLNSIGRFLETEQGYEFRPVKEIHGHTFSEVSVGILLGFFIAVAFCNL